MRNSIGHRYPITEMRVHKSRHAGEHKPDFDGLVFCNLILEFVAAELQLHEKAREFGALLLGRVLMSGVRAVSSNSNFMRISTGSSTQKKPRMPALRQQSSNSLVARQAMPSAGRLVGVTRRVDTPEVAQTKRVRFSSFSNQKRNGPRSLPTMFSTCGSPGLPPDAGDNS